MSAYVIITPAHNEEAFIEQTIHSMVQQTVRPLKWVIVNDASTDGTEEVVKRYASAYPFIWLTNVQRARERHFGHKVEAFNRGLAELADLEYAYVGNLDADISLDANYFEQILHEFARDPQLGIAGGQVFTKVGNRFLSFDKTPDSVGGQVQLFRRRCFEEIGGYLPLKYGGIDAAAEIMARMKGWRVKKYGEYKVREHRRTGSSGAGPLAAKMREGRRFYSVGYSLPFYLLRCAYRLKDRPIILGSAAGLLGYLRSMVLRHPIVVPPEVVRYLRTEQRRKLRRALRSPIGPGFTS